MFIQNYIENSVESWPPVGWSGHHTQSPVEIFDWKNEEIQLDFFGYLAGESIRFRRFKQNNTRKNQLDSLGHLSDGVVIKRFCWIPSGAKLPTLPPWPQWGWSWKEGAECYDEEQQWRKVENIHFLGSFIKTQESNAMQCSSEPDYFLLQLLQRGCGVEWRGGDLL